MSRTITVSDIRKLIDRAIAEGDPSVDTLSRDSDVGKRFIANLINAQGEGSVGAQAGGGPGQARHGEHDPATSGAAGGEGEAARDDNDEESGPLPSTADELLWLWILVRAACGKFAATMRASRAAAGAAEASSPRHPPPNISEKPSIIIIFIRFSLDDQFKTTADANGFGIFIARIISVLGATWKLFDRYKHGRKREPTWIYVSFRVGSSLARFTMDANGNIVHEVWHEDAKFFGDAFRIVFWGDDAFSDDIEALRE